jgi:hypothetical protein
MRWTERSAEVRLGRLALAALSGLLALAVGRASAGSEARAALAVPRELHVGEHAHIELSLELPPEAAEPLLVTPYREGKALEVVRGRLLRSDARDPAARPLRFLLPVLATAPGTALIGVRVLAYLCAPRCRALELETHANVVVLPR